MADFRFLQDPASEKWLIMAPKRAKRPDQAKGQEPLCPFEDHLEEEMYILNEAKVVKNKYPFAPIHEIVIHSDDHHKNFDELPANKTEDVFKVFRQRFLAHKNKGQVYIFHNQGKRGGESLPHPHTQIAVVPKEVKLEIPVLNPRNVARKELKFHYIFCPNTSQWPDEVWIAPHRGGRMFGQATDEEIQELSFAVSRLIQIFDLRHGEEFPFNFYIYPGGDWYLRLIPRLKTLGGFEIGTNVYINTQDPLETFEFIKEHFDNPDFEKITSQHTASYERSV